VSGAPVLEVTGLDVAFDTIRGPVQVLHQVDLAVQGGEILGVVGESGSGKSVTALAIMRLLGEQGRITGGRVALAGTDLAGLEEAAMRKVRGRRVAMIFQEPMTSLNPLLTVGFQVAEVLVAQLGLRPRAAMARAAELLDEVGIPNAAQRARDHPHQLSGGQRQRAMIAMALACGPEILIADEPTTALDVTIQAQILELIGSLRERHEMAVLLITHDMGVIAEMADRVCVMYAGEVVEDAPVAALFRAPAHPYTRLLLEAVPRIGTRPDRLRTIEGATPSPAALPHGCRFNPRCPLVLASCRRSAVGLSVVAPQHRARCLRAAELIGKAAT